MCLCVIAELENHFRKTILLYLGIWLFSHIFACSLSDIGILSSSAVLFIALVVHSVSITLSPFEF